MHKVNQNNLYDKDYIPGLEEIEDGMYLAMLTEQLSAPDVKSAIKKWRKINNTYFNLAVKLAKTSPEITRLLAESKLERLAK